ncbi:MAG: hypothetical protein O2819_05065 [Planctomycetota bacterium]|nr:hypothetical protein [Planctomycetota bacterium]MDA1106018.1 hypothetical protein [Planctomycetota bacterium]
MIRVRADTLSAEQAAAFVASADAVDADGVPTQAKITYVRPAPGQGGASSGWIDVDVASPGVGAPAPAVVLRGLAPAGAVGCLSLSTCLLEPNGTDASLALESARGRLKDFLRIGEDWQFFDDPAAQESITQFDRARASFTSAMLSRALEERLTAAVRATELAVDAGERLAFAYASATLDKRQPKSMPAIGRVADLSSTDPVRLREDLATMKSAGESLRIVLPPPAAGSGTDPLAAVDAWVSAAFRARVPLLLGPLWDTGWSPMGSASDRPAQSRAHIDAIVRRYGSGVTQWIVAKDVERGGRSGLGLDERIDAVRRMANQVRALLPRGILALESSAPWGDQLDAHDSASLSRTVMRLLDESAPIHRLIVSISPTPESPVRDLLQLAGLLDQLRKVKIPLACMLGIPASGTTSSPAGWWRRPWSNELAEVYASRAASIALCRPWIQGMYWDARGGNAGAGPVMLAWRKVCQRLAAPVRPLGAKGADA